MTDFLLLDFGTTSTKSVRVDAQTGTLSKLETYSALANVTNRAGRSEFDVRHVHERFDQICAHYYAQQPFAGIVLCSEMHGFTVLDENDSPLTPYISWKDERSLETLRGSRAFDDVQSALGDTFKETTGMKPRPGFAPMNFLHVAREIPLPNAVRIVDLPGWLCRACGHATGYVHPTMLAGLGFYDVRERQTAHALIESIEHLGNVQIHLDTPTDSIEVAGYWAHGAERVPIYVGIGDHQCSLLGAGLVNAQSLSVNLGTGAQVSTLEDRWTPQEAETRPYFSGHMLKTITHIPGGRALAEHVEFLGEVSGQTEAIWQRLAACQIDDIQTSTLQFGLSLFPSARGYTDGGYIRHIGEGTWTLDNYLCSLLRTFVRQYVDIMRLFDPRAQMEEVLLSGGIARRLPIIQQLVEADTQYAAQGAAQIDESLLGLRAIAKAANDKIDLFEAHSTLDRDIETND